MTRLSVAEIERLLTEKRSLLEDLQSQRERILREMVIVDSQIKALGGEIGTSVPYKQNRFRNKQKLHEMIVQILKRQRDGLTLAELADAVVDSGYRSTSPHFANVVYQCLYKASDQIVRDPETQRYALKE